MEIGFAHSIFRLNNLAVLSYKWSIARGARPSVILSLRSDGLTYNPIFSTINCGKTGCSAPATHVKLQSRVTSSVTTVVSLIFFFFSLEGLGVDGWAKFCEWRWHESTLVFGWFRVLVPLPVRVDGVRIRKCWQVKVAREKRSL